MLADIPLPAKSSPIQEMSSDESRKATITVVAIGAVLVVVALLLWAHSGLWSVISGSLGAVLMVGAFAKKTLVAQCPFCGRQVGGIHRDDKPQIVRCSHCFEYSKVENRRISALDQNSVSEKPRYQSPAFTGAVWPDGCVECGAPPLRRDTLQDGNVNALGLAIGVAMLSKATLSNVPYCSAHRDAISMNYSQTKKLDLKWKSLRMMRHYLALNRGKEVLGSKVVINP
jgi:hypothetical protein